MIREQVTVGLDVAQAFDNLRIALLSDLHCGLYTDERTILQALELANSCAPDVILLVGDFVTSRLLFHWGKRNAKHAERDLAPFLPALQKLRARFGVFGVMGNHDWNVGSDCITDLVASAGVRVLRNEAVPLENEGARLWIAGVDDALKRAADLDRTLAHVPQGETVMLLAHEPDFADEAARHGIALQVSGHSHGGQVRPPFGYGYLPPLARKYPQGRYTIGNLQLYTSRGIGNVGVPFRLGAPPEVSIIDLRSVEGEASGWIQAVSRPGFPQAALEQDLNETTTQP